MLARMIATFEVGLAICANIRWCREVLVLPWRMTAALTLGSASRTKVAVAGATPARATKDTADVSVRRHCCRGCEEGAMQGIYSGLQMRGVTWGVR